ncbi:MAG: sugar phosphate isomerase/epimerase [Oscillochloris sp.]|nr:sugar phosphate isomerase/epimerase [Oscillochloris sp.]
MQLGLFTTITPTEDLGRLCDRIADMGYGSIQAHFAQGCDEQLARKLVRATGEAGLSIAAISGYANPLQPEQAPMGATLVDLADLVELMPLLDTRILVSWSGTYAGELLGPDHRNQSPAAWDALRRSVEELSPLLDQVEAILALEPYQSHTLNTAARITTFCREMNSPYLGVVLDPPNLLPPDSWGDQEAALADLCASLAPFVRLVHLKDMRLQDGKLDLPGPGRGVLNYPAFLTAMNWSDLSAPLIVEHVTIDQAEQARRFVLAQSRKVAG